MANNTSLEYGTSYGKDLEYTRYDTRDDTSFGARVTS